MSGFKGSTVLRISILDHTRRRTAIRCGQAIILVVVFFALVPTYSAEACTIFMASKEGKTLVGNNEDWVDPASHVWFIPASEGRYGRVYFGFGTELPQGGMNEQGLFMDFAAVPYRPYSFSPNKTR